MKSASTILFTTTALLSSCPSTLAFAPTTPAITRPTTTSTISTSTAATSSTSPQCNSRSRPLHATIAAAELSTMGKEEQFKILGVEEEKLALGIDTDEVLQFIGTRDDLIAKFQTDIPSFSLTEATTAADNFLMDGEMLDMYIKWSERKAEDPNWEPLYQAEPSPFDKVTNFFSQYAIYLIGGILVKDVVTEYMDKNGIEMPSFAGFGGGGGGGEAADVLVSSALDGIHHLSNTLV